MAEYELVRRYSCEPTVYGQPSEYTKQLLNKRFYEEYLKLLNGK